jgi:hypothetical protein
MSLKELGLRMSVVSILLVEKDLFVAEKNVAKRHRIIIHEQSCNMEREEKRKG